MKSRNQGLKLYTSVIAVFLVAVSTAQLSSMVLSEDNVVYAYSTNFNQAASLVNNCSGDDESSQICLNNNQEVQGKDNDVNTQISTPPGRPGPDKVLEQRQVSSFIPTDPPSLPIVQPGGTGTFSAKCNSDEIVTGGGYRISEGAFGIVEFQGATATDSTPAWTVTITNHGSTLFTFEVFAECVKLVDAP
jgi:hypothetical protein